MSTKVQAPLFRKAEKWMEQALCKGEDVHLWFADVHVTTEAKRLVRLAKEVCFECSVRMECLDWANRNEEVYGIWGGLTPKERGHRVRR